MPSQEIAAHDRLVSREYTNAWGMRMLGACLRGRTVSSIASLASLAQLYSRAKLPHVGREIEEAAPQLSDALLSDWISDFDVEENGSCFRGSVRKKNKKNSSVTLSNPNWL